MPSIVRITALALLLAAFAVLFSGTALATSQAGPSLDEESPQALVQVSLSVQPDLCLGHVTVFLSHDGGRHWRTFVQAPIHGDPTNCDVSSRRTPWFSQSSPTLTPGETEGDDADATSGNAPDDARRGDDRGAPRAAPETQVVTLTQDPEGNGTTTARLYSTVDVGEGESETYWTQVTWCVDDGDRITLRYGAESPSGKARGHGHGARGTRSR